MARQLSVLCVHGISHDDIDPDLEGSWSKSICDGLVAWNPELQDSITCDFLKYDSLSEQTPLDKQFLNLYSQLPYDSHFAAIFDCCHSGGITREGTRKARGITPPDDIRHRPLRWNAELQMWEDRPYASPSPSLTEDGGTSHLGSSGASFRIGRTVSLRSMAKKQYNATRKTPKLQGSYSRSALSRLAIVRAGQDHPNTVYGKTFRREATGAAQRAHIGCSVQEIA